MRIELLPPYCAEINPSEHLWEEMRGKDFANKVFGSMNAVEDQLVYSLARLENHMIWLRLLLALIGLLISL